MTLYMFQVFKNTDKYMFRYDSQVVLRKFSNKCNLGSNLQIFAIIINVWQEGMHLTC